MRGMIKIMMSGGERLGAHLAVSQCCGATRRGGFLSWMGQRVCGGLTMGAGDHG